MSSNLAGVFNLSLESNMLGITTRIASEDIRMEDLLQAKYENRQSLSLFNGKAKVNFEKFLFQINKKFVFSLQFVVSISLANRCLSRFYA